MGSDWTREGESLTISMSKAHSFTTQVELSGGIIFIYFSVVYRLPLVSFII